MNENKSGADERVAEMSNKQTASYFKAATKGNLKKIKALLKKVRHFRDLAKGVLATWNLIFSFDILH